MPVLDVRPRYVAPPWEVEDLSLRRTVGREAHVEPEPGPLALYRSVWPERYVVWNWVRQLFEVRETNPVSGQDWRVTLVHQWGAPPDPDTGEARTEEEIEAMVAARDPSVLMLFRPFDYQYVEERMAEWHLIRHEGHRALGERVRQRNAARQRQVLRESHERVRDWMREDRRWLPVLEAVQNGERPDCALTEKQPLVAVGVSLRQSSH